MSTKADLDTLLAAYAFLPVNNVDAHGNEIRSQPSARPRRRSPRKTKSKSKKSPKAKAKSPKPKKQPVRLHQVGLSAAEQERLYEMLNSNPHSSKKKNQTLSSEEQHWAEALMSEISAYNGSA